jgi:hypothetical protein
MRTILPAIIILVVGIYGKALAEESWEEALGRMPSH